MISGKCTIDGSKKTEHGEWPEVFGGIPHEGQIIRSKSGCEMYIDSVVHTQRKGMSCGHVFDFPFLEIRLVSKKTP